MELNKNKVVTIYHVTTYAGRVRVYEGKAKETDSYGEISYTLTEDNRYLGSIGSRIFKDVDTSTDGKAIYNAAIKKAKKVINDRMDTIRANMVALRNFERIAHDS